MLPWAPGTAAGGSCGERAQGQRALIPSEHPQGQPRTLHSVPNTAWRGLPRPHGHGDPHPCPLVPCPPAVMQLGGAALPLPPPPLHCSSVSVCPLHGKGRRAPPILVNAGPQPSVPPKVRTPAFHNTHVTVLCCPAAGSSPHIHLLPSTLAPSHLNCEGQPPTEMPHEAPKKLQTPCLAPHNPERKGQARCPTVSHAGSTCSPGSNCSNSAQCWKQDCAPSTSLATGKPEQPLWLHSAPKMGHSCKHCLHAGASTG